MGNTTWRSEPTDVEKSVDERRNAVPNHVKLRIPVMLLSSSEAASAKIRGQEGNSPERQLRSQIYAKWLRR